MRTFLAASVCSMLLVGLLAPGALAAPKPHKVAQDPDEVRGYWTKDRMRSAIPVERGKPGGGGGAKTAPLFTMLQIPLNKMTISPVPTNGKVFFTDGSFNYVCSGTAVQSANRSVVWTAGHCVNDGEGAYHSNWMFAPAYYDGVNAAYGEWPAVALDTTTSWRVNGNLGRDLGAAVVAPNAGGTLLADAVGGRNLVFNYVRDQEYLPHGYPAEKKYNGQRLWACDTRWARNDTSVQPATMAVPCGLNGGSSGGGWVVGNDPYAVGAAVASVNSYGYLGEKDVMYGPYQDDVPASADDAGDLLRRAEAVNPAP